MSQSIGRLPRVFYMAGCIIALLAAATHTVASIKQPPPPPEPERQMMEAMTTIKLEALRQMGVERTMFEIVDGFSWHWTWSVGACGLACLALRFWRKDDDGLLRFSALCAGAFFAISLAISLKFFFFIPTSFLSACLVCFALAAATARSQPASSLEPPQGVVQ
jgi:hypothetical protein